MTTFSSKVLLPAHASACSLKMLWVPSRSRQLAESDLPCVEYASGGSVARLWGPPTRPTTLDTNRRHGMNAKQGLAGSMPGHDGARQVMPRLAACQKAMRDILRQSQAAQHQACPPRTPITPPAQGENGTTGARSRLDCAHIRRHRRKTLDESRDIASRCSSDLSIPTRQAVRTR